MCRELVDGLPVVLLAVLCARTVDLVDTPLLGVIINGTNPTLLFEHKARVVVVVTLAVRLLAYNRIIGLPNRVR